MSERVDAAELRGCELYFDCFSGIAGDMTLGALLDLGVPEDVVRGELAKLPVAGWRLERERVQRGALVGTKVHVRIDGQGAHVPEQARAGEHTHEHQHRAAHAHEDARTLAHTHSHAHDETHQHPHEHTHGHGHTHDQAPGQHDPRHPHDGKHAHTHWRDIKRMLEQHLAGDVRQRALAIFERIAVVEARLHGLTVEDVAFHEVGAIDSIVDIVGAAAALAWLAPSRITSRRVPLGGGSVDTAHGRLPVPAPATLELLAGAEVEAGGDSELTTPTGAGILAASVSSYGVMPSLRVVAVGWGAGDRQLADRPNLLRVVAGVRAAAAEPIDCVVVEANVDDMNPQWCEPLADACFAAGAVDVWFTPIVMKKGRPALMVGALCAVEARERVAHAMMRESTTIGVRFSSVTRQTLQRRIVSVDTPWGKVDVKVAGETEGGIVNATPEFEDCRRVGEAAGVPVKQVYLAAMAAFYRL